MANHVHVVVGVPGDPEPERLLADFKAWGTRRLNRGWGRREHWWTQGGSKEDAIRTRLRMSPTTYRRILTGLTGSDEAEALDPLLVRRLRRQQDERRRARFEGRPAGGAGGGRRLR